MGAGVNLPDPIPAFRLTPYITCMRKAVTLNMLQRHEESREAAVAGYLLRGSDSISKECVSQWLIATRKLYDDFYKSAVLPTGTVILSDAGTLSLCFKSCSQERRQL